MKLRQMQTITIRSLRVVLILFFACLLALPGTSAMAAEKTIPAICSPEIIVTSNADSGPGTLRQAIVDVCDFGLITFDGDMTILLTSTGLTISKNLVIDGETNAVTISGNDTWRVIYIPAGIVNLDHLAIVHGFTTSGGGGIMNYGNLTITDSRISSNRSAEGGGIYHGSGTLLIEDTTLDANGTLGSTFGGALYAYFGSVTIRNSTFSGNQGGSGGAIYNASTSATCSGTPGMVITNSTISGNSASSNGAAIRNFNGLVEIRHTTISGNSSASTGSSSAAIYSYNDTLTCTRVGNSIIAGNTPADLSANTFTQRYNSLDYNVIGLAAGNVDFTLDFTGANDQVNVTNPLLGTLADNGGETETRALLPGSPALDTGPATCTEPLDQRGVPRPLNDACDSGAFELRSDNTTPLVVFGTGSVPPSEGAILTVGPTQLLIQFSENVLGDGSRHAANSGWNYLLLAPGLNKVFDTTVTSPGICDSDHVITPDDERIDITSISYDPVSFTATLTVNENVPLPIGTYRLYVCGAASIWDLSGNPFNNGANLAMNFSVDPAGNIIVNPAAPATTLPDTGFPQGSVTLLPEQGTAYSATDLWLEIPALDVEMNIVGVPQNGGTWDVTWLGRSAGWLQGSAFPTWNGNSVLTGHVWNADNTPGPFAALGSMEWNDTVIVHAFGQEYVYQVRSVRKVTPGAVNAVLQHEDLPWLTLVSCSGYSEDTGLYRYRTLVRAVLVGVR